MSLKEGVNCKCGEHEADNGRYYGADNLASLHPYLIAPTYGLKHAPEAVQEVETYCDEPDDVYCKNPPGTEGCGKKNVRVFSLSAGELLKLHLCSEVGKVEEKEAEDDDTKDEHVFGRP